jgi:hypothetical protein
MAFHAGIDGDIEVLFGIVGVVVNLVLGVKKLLGVIFEKIIHFLVLSHFCLEDILEI